MWNSPKVGILGGGQLGRMLVESANRLNIQANVLDVENSPAKQISAHDGHVTGSFKERESVRKLAESCDVITAEIEHVDTYALEEVASKVRVEPSWQAIRTIQNKFNQKEHLRKYGIPMADHRELQNNTPQELAQIGEQLGYPMMLKSKTMAYDGRGESCIHLVVYIAVLMVYKETSVSTPKQTFPRLLKLLRTDLSMPRNGPTSRWLVPYARYRLRYSLM